MQVTASDGFGNYAATFNAAQMHIFERAFREIEKGVYLVLGESSCKRTSTLAYAVTILNFVGYKILVVAEENLFLDNFMIKSEEAQTEFLGALGDDKSSTISE
jgi:K+-transporting ATPase A subunit